MKYRNSCQNVKHEGEKNLSQSNWMTQYHVILPELDFLFFYFSLLAFLQATKFQIFQSSSVMEVSLNLPVLYSQKETDGLVIVTFIFSKSFELGLAVVASGQRSRHYHKSKPRPCNSNLSKVLFVIELAYLSSLARVSGSEVITLNHPNTLNLWLPRQRFTLEKLMRINLRLTVEPFHRLTGTNKKKKLN